MHSTNSILSLRDQYSFLFSFFFFEERRPTSFSDELINSFINITNAFAMRRIKQTMRSDARPRQRVMHECITEVIRYARTFKRGEKKSGVF